MLKVQYQNYQEFILLKIKQLFLRENNAGLGRGYLYTLHTHAGFNHKASPVITNQRVSQVTSVLSKWGPRWLY